MEASTAFTMLVYQTLSPHPNVKGKKWSDYARIISMQNGFWGPYEIVRNGSHQRRVLGAMCNKNSLYV